MVTTLPYGSWPSPLTADLLATGGTDYHGDGITYAEARSKLSVPREVGDRLLEALAAPIR